MKKYILALALLFICHIGFAQNLNSLFDEFGKEPNAECINISPFMMTIGKMFMGNDNDAKLARKFKSTSNPQLSSSASFLRLNVLSSLN